MSKSKWIKVISILLTLLMILTGGIYIAKQNKVRKTNEFIAYSKIEDSHKLYIKNKETNEEKLLLDKGVINVCTDGEWVYYIPGDFEGIFRIKMDGSENTKISTLEPMYPIGSTVKIESEMKKGRIIYRIIQYVEAGSTLEIPDRFYELNLQNNVITKIE